MGGVGDRLAAAGLADVLDAGDEVADLAGSEGGHLDVERRAHPDLLDVVGPTGLHEPEAGPRDQGAVDDPDGADHAPVLVVVGVEDQALQGGIRVARGRGNAIADGIEQLRHAVAGLGGQPEDLVGRHPEHPFDLVGVAVGIGRRAGRSC